MIFLIEIIRAHPLGHEFQSGLIFQRQFDMEEEYLGGDSTEHSNSDYIQGSNEANEPSVPLILNPLNVADTIVPGVLPKAPLQHGGGHKMVEDHQ